MANVVVYIPARDEREFEAEGVDSGEWTRAVVKAALEERRAGRQGLQRKPVLSPEKRGGEVRTDFK